MNSLDPVSIKNEKKLMNIPLKHTPLIFFGLLILFSYLFYTHAWMVDDAYITFRTIDNFVQGYGLRWNVVERVQTYSNPLWMFLLIPFYVITGEIFYTTFVVSWVLCVGLFVLLYLRCSSDLRWKSLLFLLLAMTSKSLMDFTGSGLENPLSYFLLVFFYSRYLHFRDSSPSSSEATLLFFIASLAFVNRQDALLLYLFPLIHLLWIEWKKQEGRCFKLLSLATLPATLWVLFCLFYYGFLFPNTAYAKVLTPGVLFGERVARGWKYFQISLFWEPLNYALLLCSFVWAMTQKNTRALLALMGILADFVFVLTKAAVSNYMVGRFFSLPFLTLFLILVALVPKRKYFRGFVWILVFYTFWNPMSPLKLGTTLYEHPETMESLYGYGDSIWHYHNQNVVLKRFPQSFLESCSRCRKVYDQGQTLKHFSPQDKKFLDHPWFHEGSRLRQQESQVHVGGALNTAGIGFFGFAAGPDKFIVDDFGLGDILLARLPADNLHKNWQPGHFRRELPEGYAESLPEKENQLKDPHLKEYYDVLRRITRGPLFQWQRGIDILYINLGKYDALVEAYSQEKKKKEAKK